MGSKKYTYKSVYSLHYHRLVIPRVLVNILPTAQAASSSGILELQCATVIGVPSLKDCDDLPDGLSVQSTAADLRHTAGAECLREGVGGNHEVVNEPKIESKNDRQSFRYIHLLSRHTGMASKSTF